MSFTQQQLEEAYGQIKQGRSAPYTRQQLDQAEAQMIQDRLDDFKFADLAVDKLNQLLGRVDFFQKMGTPYVSAEPWTLHHELTAQVSEYDERQIPAVVAQLVQAGVSMKPYSGSGNAEGEFDVSTDTAFAGRAKQKYTVKITVFNSHWSGY